MRGWQKGKGMFCYRTPVGCRRPRWHLFFFCPDSPGSAHLLSIFLLLLLLLLFAQPLTGVYCHRTNQPTDRPTVGHLIAFRSDTVGPAGRFSANSKRRRMVAPQVAQRTSSKYRVMWNDAMTRPWSRERGLHHIGWRQARTTTSTWLECQIMAYK